jgi:hypothetical protein
MVNHASQPCEQPLGLVLEVRSEDEVYCKGAKLGCNACGKPVTRADLEERNLITLGSSEDPSFLYLHECSVQDS